MHFRALHLPKLMFSNSIRNLIGGSIDKSAINVRRDDVRLLSWAQGTSRPKTRQNSSKVHAGSFEELEEWIIGRYLDGHAVCVSKMDWESAALNVIPKVIRGHGGHGHVVVKHLTPGHQEEGDVMGSDGDVVVNRK